MAEIEKKEEMDMDEVELTLRRFAMSSNDQALTKLLNSMFPSGIAEDTDDDDTAETEDKD